MHTRTKVGLKILSAVFAVGGALTLSLYVAQNDFIVDFVVRFGHTGTLIAGFVSGFNVILPVPAITLLPIFVAADLSIVTTVLVLTLGMTLGDGVGYLVGFIGRESMKSTATMEKINSMVGTYQEKYPTLVPIGVMAYAAVVPLPNELVVVPLSVLGYKIRSLAPLIFMGNLIFNTLGALAITGLFVL